MHRRTESWASWYSIVDDILQKKKNGQEGKEHRPAPSELHILKSFRAKYF